MTVEFEEGVRGVDDGFIRGFITTETGGHESGHISVYKGLLLTRRFDGCAERRDDLGPAFFSVLLRHLI